MRFLAVFLLGVMFGLPAAAAEQESSHTDNMVNIRPAIALLSDADRKDIKRIEDYLGGIKSISAKFSQTSPDGNIAHGKFYLQRPGKLRMEYDPPVPVLVITSNENMVYYDKELDQVTHVPLSSTIVGFLARDQVKFDDSVVITSFKNDAQMLRVSVVQRLAPKNGMMTLEFMDKPLALKNIIMTDEGGQSTTVSLADSQFGVKLDPELFIFRDPHPMGRKPFKK